MGDDHTFLGPLMIICGLFFVTSVFVIALSRGWFYKEAPDSVAAPDDQHEPTVTPGAG